MILIAAALALLLFWRLSDLLVLVFGAVIVAVLLSATAEPISRKTGLGKRSALAIVVLSISSAIAVFLRLTTPARGGGTAGGNEVNVLVIVVVVIIIAIIVAIAAI